MVETYKILSGKYDVNVSPKIPIVSDSVTRSNSPKISTVDHIMVLDNILFVIELLTF